jgi:hypothetical protein
MQNIPLFLNLIFGLTCLLTVLLFLKASHLSKPIAVVIFALLIFQTGLTLNGFYLIEDGLPPRVILLIGPSFISIALLFILPEGRKILNHLNLKVLTILHVIRIPVEVVLFYLCAYKAVPELMTFEGRNFDILSGISAPIIYYLYFIKRKISMRTLLIWNIACLILLVNIVVHAILSAPTPFQQFAFDQPNMAVLYSPFHLLPALVVPIVLLSHLASIRIILRHKKMTKH